MPFRLLITTSHFIFHCKVAAALLLAIVLSGCTQTAHYAQSYERMTAFKAVKWPTQSGLRLEAYYLWIAKSDVINPPEEAIVEAYAVNTGPQPISVATQPRLGESYGRNTYVIRADWFLDDVFQRPLIPSASDLHIVTLASNEAALITEYKLRYPDDLNKSNIWFRYEVPAEWGERFGIWSGKITAPIVHWPGWPYTKPITETNTQASMRN